MQAIIRGFQSLFVFGGRDQRSQFWPYAAVVIALSFIVMAGAMTVAMQSVFAEAERLAAEHPQAVQIHESATSYSVQFAPGSGLMPDMTGFFLSLGLTVALLAAAVTRRLHDRGLPGYAALIPLLFLCLGLVGMRQLMTSFASAEPDLALFGALMINNLLYLASLGGLIVILSLPGKLGENRYGPSSLPGA